MAKRSKKDSSRPVGKGSPLVYGIVFLLAGALVGGVLTTAVHMTPDKAQSGVQQGGGLSSQIKAYSDRVALNPRDGAAWVTLGNLYFDTDQPAKSIEAYSRALEINPGNPNVLTDMGVMHRALGEHQKALGAFARAIEADPRHETARMNTGVVLLHDVGDRDGAIRAWQDLVRINPQARNAEGVLISEVIMQMTGARHDPGTGAGSGPRLLAPGGGS
jgi:predicted Zn-dependent protease